MSISKGGTLVAEGQDLQAPFDLTIEYGCVAEVAPEIASDKAHQTYDATGKLIMPGVVGNEVHIPNPLQECKVWADYDEVRFGCPDVVPRQSRLVQDGDGPDHGLNQPTLATRF